MCASIFRTRAFESRYLRRSGDDRIPTTAPSLFRYTLLIQRGKAGDCRPTLEHGHLDVDVVIGEAILVPRCSRSRRTVSHDLLDEDALKRPSVLSAHAAIEHEIDGAVDKNEDIPDVAERNVDVKKDLRVNAAQKGDNPLGQFSGHEGQDNGYKHHCRPLVITVQGPFGSASDEGRPKSLTFAIDNTHDSDDHSAEDSQ